MVAEWTRRREFVFIFSLLSVYLGFAILWQDITFFDDSFYFDYGRHVHLSTFWSGFSTAPLYSSWLNFLRIFCTDPVERYFVSWGLLVVILVSTPFFMRVRGAWLYSFLLIGVPLLGRSTLAVSPYVSLFSATFFLVGLSYIVRNRLSISHAIFISVIACFLVAFCRAEYGYGVFIAATAYAVSLLLFPSQRLTRNTLTLFSIVVLLSVAMAFVVLHSDATDSSMGFAQRGSGVAFAEHFNLRAGEHHLLKGGDDPWTSTYAMEQFHVDLGRNAANTTATIGEFAKANPRLFLKHIAQNLTDPKMLVSSLIFLVLVAWPWWKREAESMQPLSAFVLLAGTPVLISSSLIYPRMHYALIVLPTLLLYFVQLVQAAQWNLSVHPLSLIVLCFILVVIGTFSPKALLRGRIMKPRLDLQIVRCMQTLEESNPGPNSMLFDPLGGPDVYLKSPHERVLVWNLANWPAFQTWVQDRRPAWVVVSPKVNSFYKVSDAELEQYLGKIMAYTPHSCPADTHVTVYVADKP